MKLYHTLMAFGLAALLLPACQDSCLDTTGQASTEEQAQEALAQKQEALFSLLTAVTDLDSLPQNWNDEGFTAQVSEDFGISTTQADAHTRYIITTSTEDANRIYRSLVSKNVTADSIITTDTWQQKGVGTITFTPQNQADLYATMTVNVKQLPGLEEVRFVPASAIPDNGYRPSGTYYQFGDVICQNIQNSDGTVTPTLWVCVRPCHNALKRSMSHWITLQMIPEGNDNANYRQPNGTQNFLPTRLAGDKADAERMIEYYADLLYYLHDTYITAFPNYNGIGEVTAERTKEGISTDTISAISSMWDEIGLWSDNPNFWVKDAEGNDKVKAFTQPMFNSMENPLKYFDNMFIADRIDSYINAFYYGYNTNYFSKGDYTVYALEMMLDKKQNKITSVNKKTYYLNNDNAFNFKELENKFSTSSAIYSTSTKKLENKFKTYNKNNINFIIKCRNGAELEGYGNSKRDIDPAHSFEKRNAQNHIFDVITSRKHLQQEAFKDINPLSTNFQTDQTDLLNNGITQTLPYYAFGDIISNTLNDKTKNLDDNNVAFTGTQICIKEANLKVNFSQSLMPENEEAIDKLRRQAIFIGYPDHDDRMTGNPVEPTEDMAKVILFQLMNAGIQQEDLKDKTQEEILPAPWNTIYALIRNYITKNGYATTTLVKNFYNKYDVYTEFKSKSNGKYYHLVRKTNEQGEQNYTYSVADIPFAQSIHEAFKEPTNALSIYTYEDKYSYQDNYGCVKSLGYRKNPTMRKQLKQTHEMLNAFLQNVKSN